MKQKNLIIIVIVAVVLLGIWALVQNGDSPRKSADAEKSVGDKVLEDFPVNDVAKITLTDGDSSVTLVRQDQSWVVSERSNYTASFQDISAALTKLWNLKIAQNIRATEATLERLQLQDPEDENANAPATRVTFYGPNDQELARLYLGDEHMETVQGAPEGRGFPNGRFLAVDDERDNIYVVMDTLNRFDADPVSWLDDRFFKVSEILSVEVDRPADAEGADWSVSREDSRADFTLGDAGEGEEIDDAKMQSLKRLLTSPSFSDVASKEEANVEELFADATTATITTAQGFTYNIKVGERNDDGEFALQMTVNADLPETPAEDQTDAQEADPAEEAPAEEAPEGEGEQPEAATEENNEAAATTERYKEKLAQEQLLQDWVYYVPQFVVQPLLQDRQELLKQEEEEPAAGAQGQAPDIPGMPGTVESEREVPGGKIQRVKVPLPGFGDGEAGEAQLEGQSRVTGQVIEAQAPQADEPQAEVSDDPQQGDPEPAEQSPEAQPDSPND